MTTSTDSAGRSEPPSRRRLLAGAAGAGLAVAAGVRHSAHAAGLPPLGTYDVVVIGSGAAGLTAALTAARQGLSCVVVEKAATFGGSAARSGAGIWVPNNPVILAAGVPDTPAKAAAYLAAVVGPDVPADRQRAFLAHGPVMISFVMAHSPLRSAGWRGTATTTPSSPAVWRTAAPSSPTSSTAPSSAPNSPASTRPTWTSPPVWSSSAPTTSGSPWPP
ncbi:FAD-dependent oxidoreductase [Streptomyces sp. NPDC003011]